jgi:hypothetical protein
MFFCPFLWWSVPRAMADVLGEPSGATQGLPEPFRTVSCLQAEEPAAGHTPVRTVSHC